MNHIYRIIFDRQHGIWKAASEHAKGQGKTSGRLTRRTEPGRAMRTSQALTDRSYFALRIPRCLSVTMLTGTLAFAMASPSLAQTCTTSPCTGNEVFQANSDGAINTGWIFNDQSVLDASVANAVSGGHQIFLGNSILNALVANAISGGTQAFNNSSILNVGATNALTNATDLSFDNSQSGVGGSVVLNGYSTVIGRITSIYQGSGLIANNGAADTVLTVDGTQQGNSLFSGVIVDSTSTSSGTLGLRKAGNSTLTLAGNNGYSGGTWIDAGVLSVSSDANLGAAAGTLTLNGGILATTANFDTARAITLNATSSIDVAANTALGLTGNITNAGGLIKRGGGTLVLTGNNSYSGGTTINSGVVSVSSDANLGAASGALFFAGNTTLATTASFNTARSFVLAGDVGVDVAANTTQGLAGPITGAGGLSKRGGGTLVLTGNNNYLGRTRIDGGVLSVSSDANLGMPIAVSPLTLNGGTLATTGSFDTARGVDLAQTNGVDVAANTALGLTGTLTGAGGLTKQGGGTLVLAGNNSYSGGTGIDDGVLSVSSDANLGAASGALTLNGGTLATTASFNTARAITLAQASNVDVNTSSALNLTGTITGSGQLTKLGSGTLTLSGTNTYTGGTTVSSGTLLAGGAGAFVANTDYAVNGGVLDLGGFNLQMSSLAGTGGTVALGAATLSANQAANTAYAGALSGSGAFIKTEAGQLTLSGINTYTGGTTVNNGTLLAGGNGAFVANTAYVVNGGVLDLGGFNLQMSSLSGTGGTVAMGAATLTVNQLANTAYAGALSGSGALSKAGTGQLTLTGANAYTGDTTISGGTLQFGDGTVAAHNTLGGDILVTAGSLAVLTPATVAVAGKVEMSDGTSLSIGSTLGATASLTAANMNLGNNIGFNLSGINATNQFEQVLIDTSAGIAGDFATVSVGGFTGAVDYLTLYTAKSADGKQYRVTYDLAWTGPNNLAHGNFTLTNASDTFTVGATLADQAANLDPAINWDGKTLTKLGGGTLVLSGNNSYSGGTVIDDGVLSVSSDANLGAAAGALTLNGGTLAATGSFNTARGIDLAQASGVDVATNTVLDLTGIVTGNGDLTKRGNGTLALSGVNTYTGGTTVSGGTLRINDRNSKAQLNSYSVTLYGGKAFEVGVDKLNLLLGVSYAWNKLDTERHVTVSGTSQTLKANYRANTTQLFAELGYEMPVGNVILEPFAGVAWSHLRTRGFSESGGSAALSARAQSYDQTTSTLGLRAKTPFSVGDTNGTVHASMGWRHAFGNVIPQARLAFNDSQPFTITGTPMARDAAVLELGADIAISRTATLGVSYGGQFGNGNRENTGLVNMRGRF